MPVVKEEISFKTRVTVHARFLQGSINHFYCPVIRPFFLPEAHDTLAAFLRTEIAACFL